MPQDRLARLTRARELERVMALVGGQEVAGGIGRRVAAAHEYRRRDARDPELARELVGRGDGIGRAGPAGRRRHARHPAPRAGRKEAPTKAPEEALQARPGSALSTRSP